MSRGSQIQLFGVGIGEPSKSLNVTAASRLNCYYDIQPAPGDKSQIAVFGTPGLEALMTMPDPATPVSGLGVDGDGKAYAIQGSSLYLLNTTPPGAATLLGTLAGGATLPEFSTSNTQLLIAGTGGLYCYNFSLDSLSECHFPTDPTGHVNATSTTFQDGYFIIATTGNEAKFYISGLYDATSWNELDYGVAEFQADTLVRVLSKNSLLYLFGSRTIEVWQNIGDLNFPFQRITGASSEYGLVAKQTIAETTDSIIGLFRNKTGDLMFMQVSGTQAANITPPDLAAAIRQEAISYASIGDLSADATAFTYSVPGHDIYHVTVGTKSWCYDVLSGTWSVMKSGTMDRHIGRYGMFQTYNTLYLYTVVSSYTDGTLFFLKPDVYSDNGETNYRELVGNHIFLPDRGTFRVNSISLDMEQGSISGDAEMRVRLSLSRDGGHTFGEEYEDSSTTGEYTRFFQYNRLGRGRDIVPKIRMTDPCKFVLIGAAADIAPYGW